MSHPSGMPAPEKEMTTAAALMLQRRERELLAQLHELLYSPSSPAPSGEPSWTSGMFNSVAADLQLTDECSPAAPCTVGGRRRGSKKRDREVEEQLVQEEHGGGGGARAKRRKKKEAAGATTRTLVTTVPDFDGYQWRKYGQKHIEAAKYPRSYYRCTNSTDQGCPAKRTVQRNEAVGGIDGGTTAPPKYTVVYTSAHTCKTTDLALVPPVILETTAVVPDDSSSSGSAASIAGTMTDSPVSSDATWSEHHGCSSQFAVDDDNLDCSWDATAVATPSAATAAALLAQEMVDFAGPIRSPVHVAAGGNWINDFFVGEPPCVLNSCHLLGF